MIHLNPNIPKRVKRFTKFTLILTLGVIAGGYMLPHRAERTAHAADPAPAPPPTDALKTAHDLSKAYQYVAKTVEPALVNISSVKKIKPQRRQWRGRQQGPGGPGGPAPFGDFGDDLFERFFGGDAPSFGAPPEGFEQRGLGSGFIVSEDGMILTNNHVVDGADELTVKLNNEKTYKAKVVGTDAKTDLAVLKIDAKDLTPVRLGDSDAIEVGELVVALGSPFGLDKTVTTGIVSAKGRSAVGIADYEDFIQTDAAINPGNSGGPLVNLDGQVVGINTAIASRSGGNMGVGFAIPSNMAKSVMESIVKDGRVVRGFLGIMIQDMNEDLAKSFGYEGTEGVLVGQVSKDGPAADSGLKDGDIIVKFDGKPMKNVQQLRNTVAATPPGQKVEVEVFRDGKTREIKLKVGEMKSDGKESLKMQDESSATDLGMDVQTITPEIAKQLGDESLKGVVVKDVEPGSPADHAGIRPNDVIVKAGDTEISDVDDLKSAIKKGDLKKGIRLQVETQGGRRFVFLKGDE
ncbi:DegQ family serine endoprotease [Candidatus Sumerlaeota bacterium]|nr:DegQ family serine endoprotease [Candidatus Sumerlaeota bacterium]MBI3736999.1 DegQ family serine endoprotease [Candidatus Sumerlaeota bacterium]